MDKEKGSPEFDWTSPHNFDRLNELLDFSDRIDAMLTDEERELLEKRQAIVDVMTADIEPFYPDGKIPDLIWDNINEVATNQVPGSGEAIDRWIELHDQTVIAERD